MSQNISISRQKNHNIGLEQISAWTQQRQKWNVKKYFAIKAQLYAARMPIINANVQQQNSLYMTTCYSDKSYL